MARAVDIGENEVSRIIFSALAFILSFYLLLHSWKWLLNTTVLVVLRMTFVSFEKYVQDDEEEEESEDVGDEEEGKITRNWSVLKTTPQLRKSKVLLSSHSVWLGSFVA